MDIFKNITSFNESVEQPVVGTPIELIFGGGCCIFFGVLGVIANIIGITAVITNRKLHTPCFLLISAQLVSACLTAFGFSTDGALFISAGAHVLDSKRTRLNCFVSGITKTMTMAPSAVLTFFVGIDRFVSITWPMNYRKIGRRFVVVSLSICIVVAVVNTIAAAVTGPEMYKTIPCYNSFLALDIYFFIYYTCHNLFFCCASVAVYASIVILVKFRKAASFGNNQSQNGSTPSRPDSSRTIVTLNQTDDVFLRQQLALLPMIAAMMILYIVTGIIPEVATSLSAFIDQGRYQPGVVVYASVLKAAGTAADVYVLTLKCREFRKSLRRIWYRVLRKTVVETVNDEIVA